MPRSGIGDSADRRCGFAARGVSSAAVTDAATVPEVIARLGAAARGGDGVAAFARLYLEVTEGIQAQLAGSVFANGRFLERLDIVFANLFFDALDAWEAGRASAPRAWAPLFEARARRGIAPLQFALAGMNAHINRDLPVALVSTCAELGLAPSGGCPEHGDFERVNDLLATVEARVKRSYLTGWLAAADRLVHRVHRLDDVIAMWDVRRAREAAWVNGQTLWALRANEVLRAQFLDALDRTVGFAGRGLLTPADSALARLARALRR